MEGLKITETAIMRQLMSENSVKALENNGFSLDGTEAKQLSFFDSEKITQPTLEDFAKCLTGQI